MRRKGKFCFSARRSPAAPRDLPQQYIRERRGDGENNRYNDGLPAQKQPRARHQLYVAEAQALLPEQQEREAVKEEKAASADGYAEQPFPVRKLAVGKQCPNCGEKKRKLQTVRYEQVFHIAQRHAQQHGES